MTAQGAVGVGPSQRQGAGLYAVESSERPSAPPPIPAERRTVAQLVAAVSATSVDGGEWSVASRSDGSECGGRLAGRRVGARARTECRCRGPRCSATQVGWCSADHHCTPLSPSRPPPARRGTSANPRHPPATAAGVTTFGPSARHRGSPAPHSASVVMCQCSVIV